MMCTLYHVSISSSAMPLSRSPKSFFFSLDFGKRHEESEEPSSFSLDETQATDRAACGDNPSVNSCVGAWHETTTLNKTESSISRAFCDPAPSARAAVDKPSLELVKVASYLSILEIGCAA